MPPNSIDPLQTQVSWTCNFDDDPGWRSQTLRPDKELLNHNSNIQWRMNVWLDEEKTSNPNEYWRSGVVYLKIYYGDKKDFYETSYAILIQDSDNKDLGMFVDHADLSDISDGSFTGKCHSFGARHILPDRNSAVKITVCLRWHKDKPMKLIQNHFDPTSDSALNTRGQLFVDLNNDELSDIVLVANDGKEIPVQSRLLTAQSHVFAAMLAHDMKENREKRISIADADSTTLEALLKYMCTRKFEPMIHSNYEVLAIAEKYDIEDLRDLCAQHIFKEVTSTNAMDALVIADMYNISSLKEKLCSYLAESVRQRLVTSEFDELKTKYTYLFGEIIPLTSEVYKDTA